jgi:hypothetical protein
MRDKVLDGLAILLAFALACAVAYCAYWVATF